MYYILSHTVNGLLLTLDVFDELCALFRPPGHDSHRHLPTSHVDVRDFDHGRGARVTLAGVVEAVVVEFSQLSRDQGPATIVASSTLSVVQ